MQHKNIETIAVHAGNKTGPSLYQLLLSEMLMVVMQAATNTREAIILTELL
jgi:hypothetical protein